jgi:hypothetical protein
MIAHVAVTALVASPTPVLAQQASLVLLDPNAWAAQLAGESVNQSIAAVGVRDPLPFFTSRAGETFTLSVGASGQEGWFGFTSTPAFWHTEGASDGLENFVLAAAGLGSPDENGNRASLLVQVPGLLPLQSGNVQALVGRNVCAVVFANQLSWSEAGTMLDGATLGTMAFTVSGVSADPGSGASTVTVTVRDARETCSAVAGAGQ